MMSLRERLAERFRVAHDVLPIGSKILQVSRVADPGALVDELESFDEDERVPYWAELWPSTVTLARHLLAGRADIRDRAVLELGCGLGMVGVSAGLAGARVLSSDYDLDAVRFARLNAVDNGVADRVSHAVMDWRRPCVTRRFEVILAADILYEARFFVPVAAALRGLLASGGRVLLTEPGRPVAQGFFDLCRRDGWRVARETVERAARASIDGGLRGRVTLYRMTLESE